VTITTAGYDGTIDEVQLADMLYRYSVEGPDDFKATTQAGDRIVAIGNGTALGPGTVDVATNLAPIQFAAAASGTSRWDLVALRRDWQPPGGLSEIVIIQGDSSQDYPDVGTATTAWNRRPGIMDDQPLHLQQVTGTLLGARIDLRCWEAHGGMIAASEKALDYLERIGARVKVGANIWSWEVVNGVAGWVKTPPAAVVKSGKTTIRIGAGASSATKAVPFTGPGGEVTPFAAAPVVMVSLSSNIAGAASQLLVSAFSENTAGFTAKIQTNDNANIGTTYDITVNWTAVLS
jgi:hypothetical protein